MISKNKGKTWSVVKTPIQQGTPSQGAFSVAIKDEHVFFISGGDYKNDSLRKNNYFYSLDAGTTWNNGVCDPYGFRSCIELINQHTLLATGLTGTDISQDGGKNWSRIDTNSYNTVSLSADKKIIYLVGRHGKIGRVDRNRNTDIFEIENVLNMQVKAWNEGNVERYMEGYWNSDSLIFVGKSGVTKGWKETLEHYKKRYPDKATMGELTFTLISKEKLGAENYLVIGKWHLQRERDEVGGHFSLIWKKIKGKWYIISDHTS